MGSGTQLTNQSIMIDEGHTLPEIIFKDLISLLILTSLSFFYRTHSSDSHLIQNMVYCVGVLATTPQNNVKFSLGQHF